MTEPHVAEDPEIRAELERRGLDVDAILAEAGKHQDKETEGFQRLAAQFAVPRLQLGGWTCRTLGADGLGCWDHRRRNLRLIHSIARADDGEVWAHVSVSRRDRVMPTWGQTRDAWWLIYDQVPGVIVVAPPQEHVDIAEVSHVWGCLTRRVVPDLSYGMGTI